MPYTELAFEAALTVFAIVLTYKAIVDVIRAITGKGGRRK